SLANRTGGRAGGREAKVIRNGFVSARAFNFAPANRGTPRRPARDSGAREFELNSSPASHLAAPNLLRRPRPRGRLETLEGQKLHSRIWAMIDRAPSPARPGEDARRSTADDCFQLCSL
ncbi:Hypothetical predicted protein, partial [Olea europaea subsp. europaea]